MKLGLTAFVGAALMASQCALAVKAPTHYLPSTEQTASFSYRKRADSIYYVETVYARITKKPLTINEIMASYEYTSCKAKDLKEKLYKSEDAAKMRCWCQVKYAEVTSNAITGICRFLGQLLDSAAGMSWTSKAMLTGEEQPDFKAPLSVLGPWVDSFNFACMRISWDAKAKALKVSSDCRIDFSASGKWTRNPEDWSKRHDTTEILNGITFRGQLDSFYFRADVAFGRSNHPGDASVTAVRCSGTATVKDSVARLHWSVKDAKTIADFSSDAAANEIWKLLGDNEKPAEALGKNACKLLEASVLDAISKLAANGHKFWEQPTKAVILE